MSSPPVLSPYLAGAAKSPLISLLEAEHEGVVLSREDLDKIAAWIDLVVPHSGDYMEGMPDEDREMYMAKLNERKELEEIEAANISEYIRDFPVSVKQDHESYKAYGNSFPGSFVFRAGAARLDFRIPVSILTEIIIVEMFNPSGRLVRRFETRRPHVNWDGRDDSGRPVEKGLYIIRLKSRNMIHSGKIIW
jgi:hypothetical protein